MEFESQLPSSTGGGRRVHNRCLSSLFFFPSASSLFKTFLVTSCRLKCLPYCRLPSTTIDLVGRNSCLPVAMLSKSQNAAERHPAPTRHFSALCHLYSKVLQCTPMYSGVHLVLHGSQGVLSGVHGVTSEYHQYSMEFKRLHWSTGSTGGVRLRTPGV